MRTADAQADLSLLWAHTHFVGFVMSRLIYIYIYLFIIWKKYNHMDASRSNNLEILKYFYFIFKFNFVLF